MLDENSIAAKHAEDDGDEAHRWRLVAKARKVFANANYCPRCGGVPAWTGDEDWGQFEVGCEGAGCTRSVYGKTMAEAVDRWNAPDLDEDDKTDPTPRPL